jgi:hypothetical protein
VVVAAPYPTMPGPEAAASFRLVRELVEAGDEVVVVSPSPSAAHHHADPGGPRGAARLARIASGADRLILRLDASSLSAGIDSPRLLPGRVGISAALRRAGTAEVRLDRVPATVSGRFAQLVLGPVDRVVVASEQEREALLAAGVDGAKVAVEPEPEAAEHAATRRSPQQAGTGTLPASPAAADLEALVRSRAAAERAATKRVTASAESEASRPLRHLIRMERAPVRSQKPGGAFVKRLIAKATAWQYDNVISHVNQLHQATIDAVDAVETQRDDDTTAS